MSSPRLGLGEILDDAAELVSKVASPFVGLLWLTSLPLRLGQAYFAARLLELGDQVRQYGDHLRGLALEVGVAFLVSLWGRAVFVRACGLRLRTLDDPGLAAVRLPVSGFLSYVYVALLVEAGFYATCITGVMAPFFVLAAGLAAATFPKMERPGLWRPLAQITRQGTQGLPLVGILLVFAAALLLAAVNLLFVFQLGLWLAGGVAGFDAARWSGLLSPANPRFLCVVLAGGWLVVEPYWLAALVVYVHKLESRSTGEDLRLWFERLRSATA
jgi:hypothetical protein